MAILVSNGNRSREAIARAALELVDREGLAALSMRRLAAELDMGTMTLYGYFRTKEDLLDAVVDAAGGVRQPPRHDGPWEDTLRAVARGMRAGLARHPSLIELRLRRPIGGPRAFRFTEAAMAALLDAGFDRAEAARAFRAIFLYVFGTVAFNEGELSDESRRRANALAGALPPDEFPLVSGMGAEVAETLGGDDQFEYGLDVVLAGIASRLQG
jgi:AcrR family transcriptional regulator